MSKDTYLDMCESMRSEPKEDEIPIEYADFPFDIQIILNVYSLLPNEWDQNGFYLGKVLTIMPYLFNLYNIEDEKESLDILLIIDEINKDIINKKQALEIKKASKKYGTKNH